MQTPCAETAELALSHLDALPTLPGIAVELLRLTCDERSRVDDLVERIAADQSLATRLLATANAPGRGSGGTVNTLNQAVVRLGFRHIRNMVLAVKVFETFPRHDPHSAFQRVEFWRHTLAVASVSQALIERTREDDELRELAFIGGLLHDVGKLALQTVFPKGYERVLALAESERGDIADHERAVLGVDHTQAGRWIAERWNLPQVLREVIWLHHVAQSPGAAGSGPRLAAIVRLADTVAREQHIGFSGNFDLSDSALDQALGMGFDAEALAQVTGGAFEAVAGYAALLGLDRPTTDELYLTSLGRANAELGRLNAELIESNQRLSIAARYFRSLTHFDQRVSARSSLGEVAGALASAGRLVLEQSGVLALAVNPRANLAEIAVATAHSEECRGESISYAEELRDWLGARAPGLAPAAGSPGDRLFRRHLDVEEGQTVWALPIIMDAQPLGALLLAARESDVRRLARESDELRLMLTSMGLAIGRTLARAAAQRLSEDLADTNRRLQQAQTEVLRSRVVTMIADVATGAGHELNNPLAVISGRAQLLLDQSHDPGQRKSLELIHAKAHECSLIVTELMRFAKPPTPKPRVVPWAPFLRDVQARWLAESAMNPARCAIVAPTLAAELDARAWVDADQYAQVLFELLHNARLAVDESQGRIEIRWRLRAQLATRPAPAAGTAWIETTVRDTGAGMPPHVLQRAFTPFYSNRPAGRGRGLGLSRSYRLVEANAGRIWLDSRAGAGTTAFLLAPEASAEQLSAGAGQLPGSPTR